MELNYLVAFGSGLVSFFAPCVVPLLPAYVGYISGVSVGELREKGRLGQYRKQVWGSAVMYVLGFSLVFVLLGTTAAQVGLVLRRYEEWLQIGGGLVVMLMAASFLGWVRLPRLKQGWSLRLPVWVEHLGYLRAMIVGVVFATAWSPCVGPVLGAILTLAANSGTVERGAMMLWFYSLGISVPFLIIAVSMSHSGGVLKRLSRYVEVVNKVAGVVLLVLGLLLFNNPLRWGPDWLTYDGLNRCLFSCASRIDLF